VAKRLVANKQPSGVCLAGLPGLLSRASNSLRALWLLGVERALWPPRRNTEGPARQETANWSAKNKASSISGRQHHQLSFSFCSSQRGGRGEWAGSGPSIWRSPNGTIAGRPRAVSGWRRATRHKSARSALGNSIEVEIVRRQKWPTKWRQAKNGRL